MAPLNSSEGILELRVKSFVGVLIQPPLGRHGGANAWRAQYRYPR